jgi:histidinol-phosphate phosphatase domain
MKSMRVIIMAGGRGTRITSVRSDVPKPLIEVAGKPILQWQIENLRDYGLKNITLVIGYLGGKIKSYFGDGSDYGVKISYFMEDLPLGTAGALFQITDLDEDFLLMCGDIMINIDFNRFIQFHKQHSSWASLVSHPNGHPYDSSILVTEKSVANSGEQPLSTHRVIAWIVKEDRSGFYKNRVNAGIEIISPLILNAVREYYVSQDAPLPDKIDLDRDVLRPNIASGRIFAYDTPEYIKDMGTPDRFLETENDILQGKVYARNLKNKQKAIFLDRDGTINKHIGFLNSLEQLELISGTAEAIKKINKSGYLTIIVSNQPVIARGECTFEKLDEIHNKLETLLGYEGAFVDAIYFCPHHPDKGFKGERPELKFDCDCRKPKPGLLLRAAQDFNIDLRKSIMIGDSLQDVEAGCNAGCKETYMIASNTPNALLQCISNLFKKRQ